MSTHGRVSTYLREQHLALIAMFLALSGGTAYALDGSNTVFSDDIVDNQVLTQDVQDDGVRSVDVRDDTDRGGGLASVDLAPNSLGTSEIANDSVRGADVDESSLATVPAATVGGLGRSADNHADCTTNADLSTSTCAEVPISTQRTSNLLATAAGSTGYYGRCWFAVVPAGISSSYQQIGQLPGRATNFLMSQVLPAVPAGTWGVRLQCRRVQSAYPAVFDDLHLSVVALARP